MNNMNYYISEKNEIDFENILRKEYKKILDDTSLRCIDVSIDLKLDDLQTLNFKKIQEDRSLYIKE